MPKSPREGMGRMAMSVAADKHSLGPGGVGVLERRLKGVRLHDRCDRARPQEGEERRLEQHGPLPHCR